MASTQEVEMLRRQLDELTAQMIEMHSTVIKHCDERSSVGTRGSHENNGTAGVETAPGGHESRKVRTVRTWQTTLTTGISHSTDTRVHSILPILPC